MFDTCYSSKHVINAQDTLLDWQVHYAGPCATPSSCVTYMNRPLFSKTCFLKTGSINKDSHTICYMKVNGILLKDKYTNVYLHYVGTDAGVNINSSSVRRRPNI